MAKLTNRVCTFAKAVRLPYVQMLALMEFNTFVWQCNQAKRI